MIRALLALSPLFLAVAVWAVSILTHKPFEVKE